MKKLHTRGFTLVELLIVIAIVGVLAAAVLASLNSARSKGSVAAVKSSFRTIASQAEIVYNTTLGDSYNTTGSTVSSATCSTLTTANTIFANVNIQKALKQAVVNASGDATCGVSSGAFAIAIRMKDNTYWCIDSVNSSGRSQTHGGVAYNALTGAAPAALASVGATACN